MSGTSPRKPLELKCESDNGYFPRVLRTDVDVPRKTRNKWHEEAKTLARPAKNGYNDPLSHLLLLDALMRLGPDQCIRAKALRDLLRKRSPQVVWDSVTIGRILTELTELATREAPPQKRPAMSSTRDRFGTFFSVVAAPETYLWLADLRAEASKRFHEELAFHANGVEPPLRTTSIWEQREAAA